MTGINMHLNGTERANTEILKGNKEHENTDLTLGKWSEQILELLLGN